VEDQNMPDATALEKELAKSPIKSQFGRPIRWWDDGFGPMWVYRETMGVLGVVRAQTWHDAFECVQDEIMDGCTFDELEPEEQEAIKAGNDVEGLTFRSNGVPSSPWAHGEYAREDLNGCMLDELTPELIKSLELQVDQSYFEEEE
jgi:hypothetical protein